jgi:hypothetical protein
MQEALATENDSEQVKDAVRRLLNGGRVPNERGYVAAILRPRGGML